MSKSITTTVAKPAAKAATKPAVKSAAKPKDKDFLAGMVSALVAAPVAPADAAKAKRDAERAARYPVATAQEASAKAAKASPVAKVAKAVVAQVPFIERKMKPGQTLHLLDERARPGNGGLLYAHTHAVFTVLNMLAVERHAVPKAQLLAMLGQRAVGYHLTKMNLEDGPKQTIRLSIKGRNWFGSRLPEGKFDTKVANAFVGMFLDGKLDYEVTGIAKENMYPAKF